ncbi:uncharacterized protein NPIL_486881 [Nephila pilipes]|uniref:GATA zinc finger domain-containing protein 14-like n=1 Tax=Nephila pilipes TaxID=299642 RepID=A0A8X6PDN5_NEPPI|nr:uncharacterized protein NPIL_486881 [Nephila pilipes]
MLFQVLFAFIIVQKNIFCIETFPKEFPKDGLNVFDFEINKLFDPPSRINFKNKGILEYMDKEINKLTLKAESVVNNGENFGYKDYTDVLLIKAPEEQSVGNKTNIGDTSKQTFNADLGNFINKPTGNRTEAESNNHVSQLSPKQGYNAQARDVIIKELGNTVPYSPEYQDKIIYIPVYDSQNSQSKKGSEHQNYAQNELSDGTLSNENKKTIGFIGVVFVHKMQPQDAIISTHIKNNFNQQNNGILHNVQNTEPTYMDIPDGSQRKLSNSISATNGLQQQIGTSGFDDETYQPVVQQIEDNRSFQTVPLNPHNEQWQTQKPANNGWRTNSGNKNVLDIPQIQGQTMSHQESPWINSQKDGSFQNTITNQDINPKGNSKLYNTERQNFDNRRQIPENPLFPPRGSATPKSSSVNRFPNSNTQPNFLNSKSNIQVDRHRMNTKNKPNNYQNVKTQQTFKPNSGVHYDDLNHMIAITDGKGSGQLVPVIKHVVIEKQMPSINNAHLFIDSEGATNYGGNRQEINQNSQTFYQAPQHSTSPSSSSIGNNNANNGNSELNAKTLAHPQWNSDLSNNINNLPQSQFLKASNHLVHPQQRRRNEEIFLHDKIKDHFKSKDENSKDYENQQKFDQKSEVTNDNSQHPFFNNLSNLNNNENSHFSQREKSFKHRNPVNQEFSNDAEIKEAFRIAGIYLQTQNENLPAHEQNNVHSHNRFETINSNEKYYHDNRRDHHHNTPLDLNTVRPTTDQRYNALYHERNNNFNVVKLRNHLLQSPRNTDLPYERKNNVNKELPKENRWKVVQNIQNTQTSVSETYKDNANRNSLHRPKQSVSTEVMDLNNQRGSLDHKNNQHSRYRVTDSFQIKDAISRRQQRNPRNQNLYTNQHQQDSQFYNTSPTQTVEPSNIDYTSKENEGVLVFTGNDRKDWKTNSQNKLNKDRTHYQQLGRKHHKNPYEENNPNTSEQRPLASVIGRSESNNDTHDKTTKAWYRRDSENTKDNESKRDGRKVDNTSAHIVNDADGADSNGFGGENFW